MRLSRPCYDKPHRCPGWAGGGWKSASDKHPCENGSIRTKTEEYHAGMTYRLYPSGDPWRFGHCVGGRINREGDRSKGCGVVTIPWALRKLDPRWWAFYTYRIRNWWQFRDWGR